MQRSADELLTIKDVARMLRLSNETVRRRCRQGRMPHLRLFGQLRFRKAEVEGWIQELAERTMAANL